MIVFQHLFMPLGIQWNTKKMLVQFNPESLFDLIKQQCKNPDHLIQKVITCNKGFWETDNYFHCVNNESNHDDSEIGINNCIILEGHEKGLVVIDVFKNGNIAGYDYIDKSDI